MNAWTDGTIARVVIFVTMGVLAIYALSAVIEKISVLAKRFRESEIFIWLPLMGATLAIIATQIGCTWWLSRQPVHLDAYHETAIEATNVAMRPVQCHITEIKYMLVAQSHGQPLESYVQQVGPCDQK